MRELLGLDERRSDYEIVTGTTAVNSDQIAVVTRSVLAILSDLGGEIAVPDADVLRGATTPTIGLTGGEVRPIMEIHVSKHTPSGVYTAIAYRSSQYWIADDDFDSKYALTVIQDVMALAETTDMSHAPIVTIPAN